MFQADFKTPPVPSGAPNGEHLIRLPIRDTKENYLDGFWQWVRRMEQDDYQGALEALCWRKPSSWTATALRERVITFFGGPNPWTVVIPNDRLVKVINDAAQFAPPNGTNPGWLMAMIPVTTEPKDPKRDDLPLIGIASSFFFREQRDHYVMEFEIFHI